MLNTVQPSSHNESAQPPARRFAYTPLGHGKALIRLIRVFAARSTQGYIKCEIRQASIDDSYVCLSYVWGEPGDEHYIMINDRIMRVRRNLHSFLDAATQKERLRERWLWVDALCIDQTNVHERNQQVQQMGMIFSGAKEVLSWLGDNTSIAMYLQRLNQKDMTWRSYSKGEGWFGKRGFKPMEYDGAIRFCTSDYWDRAWITQEVALARRITLCAGHVESKFELPQTEEFDYYKHIEKMLPHEVQKLKGRSLIFLIRQFDLKKSHDRRDRIYSLLALCGDGSDLQVDYGCQIDSFMERILHCCKQSFCLCSVQIVTSALDPERISCNFFGPIQEPYKRPFAYILLPFFAGPALPFREYNSQPYQVLGYNETK